jgi:hypothetical protein
MSFSRSAAVSSVSSLTRRFFLSAVISRSSRARTPSPSSGSIPCAFSITTSAYIIIRRRCASRTNRGFSVRAMRPSRVFVVRPTLSTVSIIPGMELRAPDRTETSSGRDASSEARAHEAPHALERLVDVGVEARGMTPPDLEVLVADLGRDREAGRHRDAEVRHFGEVRPLAAEQLLHLRVAVGTALTKK